MQPYRKTRRNSLGQFKRSIERLEHLSAPVIRNPKAAVAESLNMPFHGPQFIVARGTTFNAGRNQAKRELRGGKPVES
jgi:hypothetical protein